MFRPVYRPVFRPVARKVSEPGLLGGGIVRSKILDESLVSAWELNEASGNALDSHSTNELTETGTIGAADGGRDFARLSTSYFAIADNAALSAPNTSLSGSVWVKLTSKPANEMDIVSKFETVGDQREYRLSWLNTSDRFRFLVSTAGTSLSVAEVVANNFGAPTLGVWHHIVFWYDFQQQTINIQVDDGIPTTAYVVGSIFNGTSPFHIGALGRAAPAFYFDGVIKKCRIAKRVWTSAERTFLNTEPNYAGLNTAVTPNALNGKLFDNGIWTWFTSPVADYHNGKIYLGAFDCTASQKARVAEYSIASGVVTVVSLDPTIAQTDDHNNPAVLRLANGKILAAWSQHNGSSYSATSTNAGDASAFNSTVELSTADASYSNIVQVDFNDTVYWFFRRIGGSSGQFFRTSTDNGATWSAVTQLITSANRPYVRYLQTSGTRIDFFVTTAHPTEAVNSLYHGYLTINSSTGAREYFKSDGTSLGDDTNLPFAVTDFTLVYDGTTNECWIWDGKYIDGQPTCAFSVFPAHGTTAHEYWRGRWNGSAWVTEKICDAGTTATPDYLYFGEANYSGGICLDPTDEESVYVSREFSVRDFRIHKVTKSSGTWTVGAWISEGSPGINARPVAVDANGTTRIFWWVGRYSSYAGYSTVVFASPAPIQRT